MATIKWVAHKILDEVSTIVVWCENGFAHVSLRPSRNMKMIASCCLVLMIGHMLIVIA
jgi:hypothetical protein